MSRQPDLVAAKTFVIPDTVHQIDHQLDYNSFVKMYKE